MDTLNHTTVNQPHAGQPLLWRALGAADAWLQQRRTRHALMACSDRVLADIGIAREDIPQLARGRNALVTHEPFGWFDSLRSSLHEILAAGRARRREQAELMAYSDQELDDLGIRRIDIPAIIKRTLNPRHA
jgi:uncharacterized protein YjiS (DUF1127 family)